MQYLLDDRKLTLCGFLFVFAFFYLFMFFLRLESLITKCLNMDTNPLKSKPARKCIYHSVQQSPVFMVDQAHIMLKYIILFEIMPTTPPFTKVETTSFDENFGPSSDFSPFPAHIANNLVISFVFVEKTATWMEGT